jgi:hypothetical protein
LRHGVLRRNRGRWVAVAEATSLILGGKSTGAPKGNKNALKHGYYGATAKAQRALLKNLLTEAANLRQLLSKSES